MTEEIEDLCKQLGEQDDEAMFAEGSVLEAIRTGQFERARAAVDAAESAWRRREALRDELTEIVNAGASDA